MKNSGWVVVTNTTANTHYGVFLGAGDRWEVWLCEQQHVKLQFMSSHEFSDDAHAARRRYTEADKRRRVS